MFLLLPATPSPVAVVEDAETGGDESPVRAAAPRIRGGHVTLVVGVAPSPPPPPPHPSHPHFPPLAVLKKTLHGRRASIRIHQTRLKLALNQFQKPVFPPRNRDTLLQCRTRRDSHNVGRRLVKDFLRVSGAKGWAKLGKKIRQRCRK